MWQVFLICFYHDAFNWERFIYDREVLQVYVGPIKTLFLRYYLLGYDRLR